MANAFAQGLYRHRWQKQMAAKNCLRSNASVPLGRKAQLEEVATLVHFLAAEDCGFLNGQAINLCGGMAAG